MSDRGRFSGFNWHVEYHVSEHKKEKAADCIYLTRNRICTNNKCPKYNSKCFVASYCSLRVKKGTLPESSSSNSIHPAEPKKEKPKIKKIKCTLPLNCRVHSSVFGHGRYTGCSAEGRIIEVTFDGTPRKFVYPDAILNKYLTVSENVFKQVLHDISKAEKG